MTEKYDFSRMFMNAEIKSLPNLHDLHAELESCPFCGETPNITQSKVGWCVQCLSINCFIRPQTALCSSEEEAVKKWNTRTRTKRKK